MPAYNGVAFHPSALNYNVGLKNYCQKLFKIYLTALLLNYKLNTNNENSKIPKMPHSFRGRVEKRVMALYLNSNNIFFLPY